jgi:hypothetical protein
MDQGTTDLYRLAQRLLREATIYPQANGTLVVVIPYTLYVQLEQLTDTEEKRRARKPEDGPRPRSTSRAAKTVP